MADKNYKYGFIITGDEKDAVRALNNVDKEAKKVGGTVKNTTSVMDKFRAALAPITSVTIFGYMAARATHMALEIEKSAEKVTLLGRRMDFLTGDAQALDKVTDAAYELGVEFSSLGNTVGRFAVATKNAFSVDEILEWNKAIILASKAVGSSTEESISGVRQLSQALSKGKLDGDEFRSVVENLPALATIFREIAEETGQNIFDMSEKGLITTELMIEAFDRLKIQMEGVGGAVTHTISAEFDRVKNEWSLFVHALSEGDSMFRDMAASFAAMLRELNKSPEIINKIKVAINGFGEALEIFVTGGAIYIGLKAFNKLLLTTAGISFATTLTQLALISPAMAAAVVQTRLMAGATAALGASVAFLTGPIGWAAFAAGLIYVSGSADKLTRSFYKLIGVQEAMHDKSQKALIASLAMFRRQEANFTKRLEMATNPALIKGLEKNLQYAWDQIDVLEEQHKAYIESFEMQEKINLGLTDGADAAEHYNVWLKHNSTQTEIATGSQKKYNDMLAEAIGITLSLRTPQEIYNDTIERLIVLHRDAGLSAETFKRGVESALGTLNDATKGTEGLTKAVSENSKQASEFEVTWNRTIERLDNGWADMWRDALDGEINALDMMKNVAKDWLAEMIHMFTTKKIVASFGATMGATGTASAFGGAGGTQGTFSPLTDLFKAGASYFTAANTAGIFGSAVATGAFSSGALGAAGLAGVAGTSALGAAGAGIGAVGTTSFLAGAGATGATLTGAAASGIGAAGATAGSIGATSALAGAAGMAMAAIPYIGIAVAILGAMGVFSGNSDTSPDLSIATGSSNQPSGIKWQNEDDISFTAQSRYGNIDVMSQHGFFESDADAEEFYEVIRGKLNVLDEAIFISVDDATNAAIEKVMGRNWDTFVKFEEGGNIEGTLEKRFDRIFDSMNNSMERFYESLREGGLEYDKSTIIVTTLAQVIKGTNFDLDVARATFEKAGGATTEMVERIDEFAASLAIFANYASTDLTTAFEEFTRLQDIANETLYQSYTRNLGLIHDASLEFDWSIDSMMEMATLIADNRQLEIGLLNQIKTVSESITDLTAGYAEKWKLDTFDDKQTREYYYDQVGINYQELLDAVNSNDPTAIYKETQETLSYADKYWNTLSDEEKQDHLGGFESGLDIVNTTGQDGLSEVEKLVKDIGTTVTKAIADALNEPAENLNSASGSLRVSSKALLKTASIPVKIEISTSSSEVGY